MHRQGGLWLWRKNKNGCSNKAWLAKAGLIPAYRKVTDVFLGVNGLPKRPLSPCCAEILAAFQARMERVEADTDHGFWIQLQSTLPCWELHGDRTGNQEKLLCKQKGQLGKAKPDHTKERLGRDSRDNQKAGDTPHRSGSWLLRT